MLSFTINASATVTPSPTAWTITGLRSISAMMSGWSAASRDSATIKSASASTSAGGAPRTPSSSARAFQPVKHVVRGGAPKRYRREGYVAELLREHAAEPDISIGP